MREIQIDAATELGLADKKDIVEIRSSEGVVIGFFAPVSLEHARGHLDFAVRLSPMELRERFENRDPSKDCTTEELIERLEAMKVDA